MRRLISYIVALGLVVGCYAADYPTMSSAPGMEFRSTSSYVGGGRSSANQPQSPYGQRGLTSGSLSTISSSNFLELNSEGGACYQPSSHARKGRPGGGGGDSGGGAIGEYDFHSPVGNALWPLLLLGGLYMIRLKRKEE